MASRLNLHALHAAATDCSRKAEHIASITNELHTCTEALHGQQQTSKRLQGEIDAVQCELRHAIDMLKSSETAKARDRCSRAACVRASLFGVKPETCPEARRALPCAAQDAAKQHSTRVSQELDRLREQFDIAQKERQDLAAAFERLKEMASALEASLASAHQAQDAAKAEDEQEQARLQQAIAALNDTVASLTREKLGAVDELGAVRPRTPMCCSQARACRRGWRLDGRDGIAQPRTCVQVTSELATVKAALDVVREKHQHLQRGATEQNQAHQAERTGLLSRMAGASFVVAPSLAGKRVSVSCPLPTGRVSCRP